MTLRSSDNHIKAALFIGSSRIKFTRYFYSPRENTRAKINDIADRVYFVNASRKLSRRNSDVDREAQGIRESLFVDYRVSRYFGQYSDSCLKI